MDKTIALFQMNFWFRLMCYLHKAWSTRVTNGMEEGYAVQLTTVTYSIIVRRG